MNRITISGFANEPVFSHKTEGEKFYSFILESPRRSEAVDNIVCMISEIFLKKVIPGELLKVIGEIRTFNKNDGERKKLEVYVFAKDLVASEFPFEETENKVELDGFLCKEPIGRTTPSGRQIADFLLASNRSYGKSDYIPCIAWGRSSILIAECGKVGGKVRVTGRLQSREYTKVYPDGTQEQRTAYELSANTVEIVDDDECTA